MSKATDLEKAKYVKDKNVHHLFELLASKVLDKRPDDIYSFLKQQLTEIEEGESANRKKHDPSEIIYNNNNSGQQQAGATASSADGPKKVTFAVFGLNNAGKTALIASIGGNPDPNTKPTIGFSPITLEGDNLDVCIFDLGGHANFRGVWPHYFHDCHGVIFVVDGSDESRFAEAETCFAEVASHKYLREKPFLLVSNKKDKAGHVAADQLAQRIQAKKHIAEFSPEHAFKAVSTCAIANEVDKNIDEGVDWLLDAVSQHYTRLAALVKSQVAEVKEEQAKRLAEQRRRVEEAKTERK